MSTLRLAEFTIDEQLSWFAGWRPGEAWGRWTDWAAYLNDWQQVRAEVVAAYGAHKINGDPWFADRVDQYAARHGVDALATASYEAIHGLPEPHEGETFEHYQRRLAGR